VKQVKEKVVHQKVQQISRHFSVPTFQVSLVQIIMIVGEKSGSRINLITKPNKITLAKNCKLLLVTLGTSTPHEHGFYNYMDGMTYPEAALQEGNRIQCIVCQLPSLERNAQHKSSSKSPWPVSATYRALVTKKLTQRFN
jgi:hypothetical protein